MQLPAIGPGAIDTHAHVYPAWYLDRLEAAGVPADRTRIARDLHADSTPADIERRLEWMDRAGVAAQVLAVTPQVPSVDNAATAAELARAINDEYLRLVTEHPGRFLAYAALPLPHVEESLAELERVAERGFVGVSFPTLLPGGGSLADDALAPVWRALDERGVVVNIHPTGSGACSAPITDHGLTWVNGAPVEDAIATLQLMKAGIPTSYPRLTLHVAHLGGDLAFLAQRIEDNYTDWQAFPSSPLAMMRGMRFDAANFHEPALRLAVETYGAGRVMAGSDHPYFQDEKYVRAFDYVRHSKLGQDEIDAITSGTARALYGLADPS